MTGPAYRALALQVTCAAVNACPDRSAARAQMAASLERLAQVVPASLAFLGRDVRLVVLPEYGLTGFPMGDAVPDWAHKAALDPDGPEYELLGGIAQRSGIFLAGNAYETDPHFPDLYFQTSFVVGPDGDVVLRYRRLHSLFSPSPYDVWDRYLDVHGIDAVLPVARTELGCLAAVASEEILFPELSRALALRGAEVLVHSTSEVGSPGLTPKDIAKRARAVENLVYVVSANSAGITGTPIPAASTDGMSKVLAYTGRVLAEAGYGESMVACAELDLEALRRARRRPGMENLLSRVKPQLWAAEYARHDVERPNALVGAPAERSHFARAHAEVVQRLHDAGALS